MNETNKRHKNGGMKSQAKEGKKSDVSSLDVNC